MSIITSEEAMQHLYKQLSGTEYKPAAYWTTSKKFNLEYTSVKTEFIPETLKQLVPPKGIKPLSPRS